MAKNWNLQDIRPAAPRKRKRRVEPETKPRTPHQTVENEDDGTLRIRIADGSKKRGKGFFIAVVVFIAIIAGIFGISYTMKGAEITVHPRFSDPNVNATFTTYREPQSGQLAYEIMSLNESGERQVQASGQESVESQARGEIEIFKTTPGTQRLIKNTRFESPDGLIFKIEDSVVVPGAAKNTNGETVPGSISVRVFSDGVGEEYNLQPTKFTVPGLKSDPALFDAIYAESRKTFEGGFDGERFIIDEFELETAQQELRTELRDSLLKKIIEEIPANFVLFEDAVSFTYESHPSVRYGDDLATIKETATLRVPIFNKDDFAAFIAEATIPSYEGKPVRIDNYDSLTFAYTDTVPRIATTDISTYDSLEFIIVGKPRIVWTFDEEQLRRDLLGAQKTAFSTILGGYPAILPENTSAVVHPFWARAFPSDLEHIKVIEVIGSDK